MAAEGAAIAGSSCPAGATWRRQYGDDPQFFDLHGAEDCDDPESDGTEQQDPGPRPNPKRFKYGTQDALTGALRVLRTRKLDSFREPCVKGLAAIGVTPSQLTRAAGSVSVADPFNTRLSSTGRRPVDLKLPLNFVMTHPDPTVQDALVQSGVSAFTEGDTIFAEDAPRSRATISALAMHETLL